VIDVVRFVYEHWFLTCTFIATGGFWAAAVAYAFTYEVDE
jgi:hypothetical protein